MVVVAAAVQEVAAVVEQAGGQQSQPLQLVAAVAVLPVVAEAAAGAPETVRAQEEAQQAARPFLLDSSFPCGLKAPCTAMCRSGTRYPQD